MCALRLWRWFCVPGFRRLARVDGRSVVLRSAAWLGFIELKQRCQATMWMVSTKPTVVPGACALQRSARQSSASQRSLHNAPIFRLLLKVAVNGTHQCDFLNFCGTLGSQQVCGLAVCVSVGLYLSLCLCLSCSCWSFAAPQKLDKSH